VSPACPAKINGHRRVYRAGCMMFTGRGLGDYENVFAEAIAGLKAEGRYRTFADLERHCGRFPYATWHTPRGPVEVTVVSQ
jgi:hypothetical protein